MPKILIAEDDFMIADMTEEFLLAQGYEVCGIARTVADAISLARQHGPDLALLDLRLAEGGLGTQIASALAPFADLGILYATGNISQVNLSARDGHACLSKPYVPADLLRSLELVAGMVATGTAPPPYPRGFAILAAEPPASAGASR